MLGASLKVGKTLDKGAGFELFSSLLERERWCLRRRLDLERDLDRLERLLECVSTRSTFYYSTFEKNAENEKKNDAFYAFYDHENENDGHVYDYDTHLLNVIFSHVEIVMISPLVRHPLIFAF